MEEYINPNWTRGTLTQKRVSASVTCLCYDVTLCSSAQHYSRNWFDKCGIWLHCSHTYVNDIRIIL